MTAPHPRLAARTGLPWAFRGIQMDLARHRETVDYVRRQADAAARDGFNALVLYIEGRVRTESFPWRPAADSYSLNEMDRIVRHAQGNGLDVIPVVSTLGHCEQFLSCEPLRPLGEARHGRGRFSPPSNGGTVLCPSQEATYSFLDRYLHELAQVFTGPNLHVGLDEAWDLGYCRPCRRRWRRDGLASLFMGHLARMHAIARRLNRRLWIWDDFFELAPDKVADIPKDVVLCHWCYDDVIDPEGPRAHFVNRARVDWLARYERLGLDVVACPWARYPRSIEAITDYARRHRVLGGLLTQWEGSPRFHPGQSVIAGFTGALWRGRAYKPEAAWRTSLLRKLPGAPLALRDALRDWLRLFPQQAPGSLQSFLSGPTVREEALAQAVLRAAGAAIRADGHRVRPPARAALAAMAWGVAADLLLGELHELAVAALHPRRQLVDEPALRRRFATWQRAYRALLRRRAAAFAFPRTWAQADDCRLAEPWQTLPERIQPIQAALERRPGRQDWLLILRLFLQDFHGAPHLRVTVHSQDQRQVVVDGTLKPAALMIGRMGGHYDVYVPFVGSKQPDALQLEVWGYGGQGVCFVQLMNPTVTLTPAGIQRCSGPVVAPDALLRDDSRAALLGCADILAQMHSPRLAERRARVVLILEAKESPRRLRRDACALPVARRRSPIRPARARIDAPHKRGTYRTAQTHPTVDGPTTRTRTPTRARESPEIGQDVSVRVGVRVGGGGSPARNEESGERST